MKRLLPLLLLACLPAHATSTITFVASAAGTTSVTVPAHLQGDLFIAYAFRNNSNTQPTLPSGWVAVHNTGGTGTASDLVACKIAQNAAETATGFTNATGMILLIYRGTVITGPQNCPTVPLGGSAAQQSTGSATISYDGFTLSDLGTTSWVIGCAGSVTATDLATPPTGMTNRATATSGAVACADTNGKVAAWTTQTVGVNANAAWQSFTMEIRACITRACLRNSFGASSAASNTTISIAASPHTAGNKLIVYTFSDTTTARVSSIANTAGDTWAICTGSIESTLRHSEMWSTTNVPIGNAADAVTITYVANDTGKFGFVTEVSGLTTGACEGAAVGNVTANTTLTSGTLTPAASGNFNFAGYFASTNATWTNGTNYLLSLSNTVTPFVEQYRLSSPSGAQTITITTALSTNMAVSAGTFKIGGGAGQIGLFSPGP